MVRETRSTLAVAARSVSAHGGTSFSAATLHALFAGACTVSNPAFDPPSPGGTTGTAGNTAPGSTQDASTTTAPSPTTAADSTETGGTTSEAADVTGVGTSGTTGTEAATDTSTDATGSTSGDDELASTGAQDGEVVLKASKTYDPSIFYPGDLQLMPPRTLLVPPLLQVTIGNAGNHQATLQAELEDSSVVTCTYRGGSSQANPQPDTAEWEQGLKYLLESCDDGSQAGGMLDVKALHLAIDNGASSQPPEAPQTTAIAVLPSI